MDEKWTGGRGGQKRPKMGGRPLYKPPNDACLGLPKMISALACSSLSEMMMGPITPKKFRDP